MTQRFANSGHGVQSSIESLGKFLSERRIVVPSCFGWIGNCPDEGADTVSELVGMVRSHDHLWAELAAALEAASLKHGKNLEPNELHAADDMVEWLKNRTAA
jgi:hypothetical protein